MNIQKSPAEIILDQEKQFTNLLSDLPDVVFIHKDGIILYANQAACISTEYSLNELLGSHVLNYVVKEDRELVIKNMERRIAGEVVGDYECGLIRRTGEIRIAIVRATDTYYNGEPGVLFILIDITERLTAEIKLKESEQKFKVLAESTPAGIFVYQDDKFVYVNRAAEIISGYSNDELLGMNYWYFIAPEFQQVIKERSRKRRSGEELSPLFDVKIISKDGLEKWISLSGSLVELNGKTAVLVTIVDITNRKMVEAELLRINQKLEAIISASPDGIGMISLDGKIQLMSEKLIKMYGYSVEQKNELLGKSSFDFIDPSDHKRLLNNMGKLLAEKKNINLSEYLAVKKDNTRFYIEVNSALLLDNNGNPESILFVERDVTERKMIEEKIKNANIELEKSNTEKDKLFSIIAHDLRSPFHGLLGLTEVMDSESHILSSEEIKVYSQELHKSVVNLHALLENLLEWALLQKDSINFDPKPLSLFNIFSQCIDSTKQRAIQKGITLFNEIPITLTIYADEKMINSVLRNLLSNAIKFTEKGGEVVGKAIEIESGFAKISVTDNGVGIPGNIIGKLFKLGEKVSSKGTENELSTGLGLLLCKEFVEKHNGKIWVESQEKIGSTFYYTIPMYKY